MVHLYLFAKQMIRVEVVSTCGHKSQLCSYTIVLRFRRVDFHIIMRHPTGYSLACHPMNFGIYSICIIISELKTARFLSNFFLTFLLILFALMANNLVFSRHGHCLFVNGIEYHCIDGWACDHP